MRRPNERFLHICSKVQSYWGQRGNDSPFNRLRGKDLPYIALTVMYVILFTVQINQPPFERYPGWDWFWVDVVHAGKLIALKYALAHFELPAINPYVDFGWNVAGDTTMPSSFMSPINLLVFFVSPRTIILLQTMVFLALGAAGAYLFLRKVTQDRFASFFGALSYVSIHFVISNFYYHNALHELLLTPLFLYTIHSMLEGMSPLRLLLFVALSVFAAGAGDIYLFVAILPVIAVYTFVAALGYYRTGLAGAVRKSATLVALFLLSSAFFIVPLYNNLHEIGVVSRVLTKAGIYAPQAPVTLRFFFTFFRELMLQGLYKPIEGSGGQLYVPIFFYFAIGTSLLLWKKLFWDDARGIVVVLALLLLVASMLLVSVVFYSIPAIASMGHGVLRIHLNLIPFVLVLAGFVCFATVNRTRDVRKGFYLLVIVESLVVDWMLFGLAWSPPTDSTELLFYVRHTVTEGFRSSNLVPVRFRADMWPVLPWVNLSFLALLFAGGLVADLKWAVARRVLSGGLILVALLLPLLSISVHNELRATQQAEWQMVARNSYRWESYLERKACIDSLIDRGDPNYRTLPAGRDIFGGSGRNWEFIAETEMNVQDREKILFSYRETMHPYAALLYSTFIGGFQASNWMPPLSSSVPGNIPILHLMGVRRVISADEPIDSPDLIYKGKCIAAPAPPFAGSGADGTVYVYGVRNPLGVVFLADNYQLASQSQAFTTLLQKQDAPWDRGIVYLEVEPTAERAVNGETSSDEVMASLGEHAEIVQETFNSVAVNVSTPTEKYLVLSYIYRPYWRAYLDDTELEVYRAYGGFMAVKVPPGQYTVRFRYAPFDVYLGLALTVLAFLVPLACHLLGSQSRRLKYMDIAQNSS